jgi:hypothetical protein
MLHVEVDNRVNEHDEDIAKFKNREIKAKEIL